MSAELYCRNESEFSASSLLTSGNSNRWLEDADKSSFTLTTSSAPTTLICALAALALSVLLQEFWCSPGTEHCAEQCRSHYPQGVSWQSAPEAAGLGWKPPLKAWRQECMVRSHPLPTRRTGSSAGASRNLMPSWPSRTPNHWIQWRHLWNMLWCVRKYKTVPVCIIKNSEKIDYSKWFLLLGNI